MAFALYLIIYTGLMILHWKVPFQDPRKMIFYLFGVFVTVPSLWILSHPNTTKYWTYDFHMDATFVAFILFLLIFLVTAHGAKRLPVLWRPRFNVDRRLVWAAAGLLALSAYAKAYLFANGMFLLEDKYAEDGYASAPPIIMLLNNVHLVGLPLVYAYYDRKKTNARLIGRRASPALLAFVVLYFTYSSGTALLQGRRFGVLMPLLFILLVAQIKRRLSRRQLAGAVAGVVLTFGLLTSLRLLQAGAMASGASGSTASGTLDVITSVFSDSSSARSGEGNELLHSSASRLGNPVIIANHIINYVDQHGSPDSANSFGMALFGLVPRFLWTDKPALAIGNDLGRRLGVISEENLSTKINPGWVGEGYYNLGFLGVALAAVLMGLFATVAYRALDFESDAGVVLFLPYFVFLFSGFQMEIAFSFNNFLKAFLMTGLLLAFLGVRHRRRGRGWQAESLT
jgi:hypothetical protein